MAEPRRRNRMRGADLPRRLARRIRRTVRHRRAAPQPPRPEGTALSLSYPTSAANRPRWGHGRPPHRGLEELLARHAGDYRAELTRLAGFTADLAAIPRDETSPGEPHWSNTWFTGLDAVSLYGYLRLRAPARYVEIGSGNSTRFAARARRDGGLATEITSIDPDPRVGIDELCDHALRRPLEEVDLGLFAGLGPGDIVLVDSSHGVFMNSDAVTFHLEVLPALPKGVLVGVHDVYWPADYPPHLAQLYLSEQYVVGMLLLGEPEWARPVLACAYVTEHPELAAPLAALWADPRLTGIERSGSLLWLAIER